MYAYRWTDLHGMIGMPGFRLGLLYVLCIAAYLAYWFAVEHEQVHAWFQRRYGPAWRRRLFVSNKLWGSLLFSLVLFASLVLFPGYRGATPGLSITREALIPTLLWSLGLIPLAAVITGLQNRKLFRQGKLPTRYPEAGADGWNRRSLVIHIVFWSIYLTAYEIVFRGVLLIIPATMTGPWAAVGMNVALYSAVHMPKGAQEASGALVLGTLLCLVTLTTGNVYTAVSVHIALAVSNGLWAKVVHDRMAV